MKWWRGLRTQKSMIQWCKQEYRKAWDEYKMNARCFPTDGPCISADMATVKVWRGILYYLTEDEQWSD
jgi:hypothetical protein